MASTYPEVTAISVDTDTTTRYVDWGAIFAGVFVAIAISSVFLAFGSAIGLSLTSFRSAESAPVIGLVIAAGLWILWVQISSFIGGAYVTGRMRCRIGDAQPHEVTMRDGAHGLIMWAVNIVIGSVLAGWIAIAGVSGVVSTASNSGAMDYYADRLMRNDAVTGTASVSPDAQYNSQISRILTRNVAAKAVDETDRSYLAREITARTGLAEADAKKRVDDTLANLKAQAETARRFGVLLAFLTAASLLISGVAAWWAATAGGKHRDEGTDHSYFSSWR